MENLSPDAILTQQWQSNWEALEACRLTEEKLAEKQIPVHALIPARVKLTKILLGLSIEQRRKDAQNSAHQRAAQQHCPRVPDGERVGVPDSDKPPPGLQAAQPQKKCDCKTILQGLGIHTWEALDRCRITEERLADRNIPTHGLAPAIGSLIKVAVDILAESRRNDAQTFLTQQFVKIDGSAPAPLSNAAKQGLREFLRQFPREEHKVLWQICDPEEPVEETKSGDDKKQPTNGRDDKKRPSKSSDEGKEQSKGGDCDKGSSKGGDNK